MTENVLTVKELSKSYEGKPAVSNINIVMNKGDFLGFLGPNGAGKTTTIKMLNGLLRPDKGEILYYNQNFFDAPLYAKKVIGVVMQHNNVDVDLTAYENLYLHTILYHVEKSQRDAKIQDMLEFSGLTEYRDQRVRSFSGGMKRRLSIIRALLHEPSILFLDEPTVGLDPQIRRSMWDFILKINQLKKTAIFLTTHYIEEAEKLCSKISIIHKGSIIVEGAPDKLKQGLGGFVLETYHDDGIRETFFDSKEQAVMELKHCSVSCKIRELNLEDVFLKFTGRKINV
jgi:ABC-2 type transport system ATP-binding protein